MRLGLVRPVIEQRRGEIGRRGEGKKERRGEGEKGGGQYMGSSE